MGRAQHRIDQCLASLQMSDDTHRRPGLPWEIIDHISTQAFHQRLRLNRAFVSFSPMWPGDNAFCRMHTDFESSGTAIACKLFNENLGTGKHLLPKKGEPVEITGRHGKCTMFEFQTESDLEEFMESLVDCRVCVPGSFIRL